MVIIFIIAVGYFIVIALCHSYYLGETNNAIYKIVPTVRL